MKTLDPGRPLLPHDLHSERDLLNGALEWGKVPPGLRPELFFRQAHDLTCRAVLQADGQGLAPYEPIVRNILTERNELDTVGSIYLNDLAKDGVFPSADRLRALVQHLEILLHKRRAAEIVLRYNQDISAVDVGQLVRDLNTLRIVRGVGLKASFRTAKDLADAASHVEWLIRGYLALGAVTELTGKAKLAGKTTLIAYLVACLVTGDTCFSHATIQTPVVYLTEQTAATFREVLRRAGLLGREDISVLSYWDVKGMSWPAIAELAGREADRIGSKLIVVDTLPQFAGIKGDGENNSGDALDAIAPLQQQAHKGLALLVSRHSRKSGGEVGEDGRGSSAFTGGVDIVLSLKRPEGNHRPTLRLLEGLSRYDETPARMVIEKVRVQRPALGIEVWAETFEVLGDSDAVAIDDAKAALIHMLPGSAGLGLTMADLMVGTGMPRVTLERAMKAVPNIRRIGKGRKNDPLRYFREEMNCAQTSITEVLIGQNHTGELQR